MLLNDYLWQLIEANVQILGEGAFEKQFAKQPLYRFGLIIQKSTGVGPALNLLTYSLRRYFSILFYYNHCLCIGKISSAQGVVIYPAAKRCSVKVNAVVAARKVAAVSFYHFTKLVEDD